VLRLRTFRIGAPREPGEGLRIGATRRPPRGVARERWRSEGLFDVWFPVLAPSHELLSQVRRDGLDDEKARERFFARYEREILGRAESRQAVELLAALALKTPLSIGCFCKDESRCHRSRLRRLIEQAAREM
jgi:uncharacterized protein YeaO (DUF488 family)